jgi:hypothetical protein
VETCGHMHDTAPDQAVVETLAQPRDVLRHHALALTCSGGVQDGESLYMSCLFQLRAGTNPHARSPVSRFTRDALRDCALALA